MIKAIIFDFDGLILDTEYAEFTAWQQLYSELGFEMLLEDWTQVIGRGASTIEWSPYQDLAEKLGAKYDEVSIRQRRKELLEPCLKNEKVLPGVIEMIQSAKDAGLGLAVASSSPRVWVEGFLVQLGLREFFSVVRTADDVTFAKPEPELYLAALAALDGLGLKADEAFALEDSANGTTAAIAAGLFCVVVPNRLTRHTNLDHASFMVDSLANVTLGQLVERAEAFYEDHCR